MNYVASQVFKRAGRPLIIHRVTQDQSGSTEHCWALLGTLEEDQKADWKRYLGSLVYAYNCTPHEATRVSPYELLFGRKPKLPIDTLFDKAREESVAKTTHEYLEQLQEQIVKTNEIVIKHTQKSQEKQKKYYDRKSKSVKIEIGDGSSEKARI